VAKYASDEIVDAINSVIRAQNKISLPAGEAQFVDAMRLLRDTEKSLRVAEEELRKIFLDVQTVESFGVPD